MRKLRWMWSAWVILSAACGGASEPVDATLAAALVKPSDAIPSGYGTDLYRISTPASSGCLQVSGFTAASGFYATLGDCGPITSARWQFVPLASGNYAIVNYLSKKCLDVAWASTANGAGVFQWDCTGGASQQWSTVEVSSGRYQLRASHSGKCLTGPGAKQWDCSSDPAQQWKIELSETTAIQIHTASAASPIKCLDVDGFNVLDGGKVQQWDCTGGDNQRWFFVENQDRSFEFKARHSGKCLDIAGAGVDNGTLAQQWWCAGVPQQHFFISPGFATSGGAGWILKAGHVPKCLDRDRDNNDTNGAKVQLWNCIDRAINQDWLLPSY